jgi:recombination protein RecR
MYPPAIQKLIELFSKFPTVGTRTAARFVFYLMGKGQEEIEELVATISEIKKNVKICRFCFNPFDFARRSLGEGGAELCPICSNPSRDKTLLCVVEKEIDLDAIEKIKKYRGLYFILGGTVSFLKKKKIKELRLEELKVRLENPQKFGLFGADFKEVIIATNSTTEGEATAFYLERVLRPYNKKISRLGRGLPIGGELEYADEETLASALESRR